MFLRRYYYPNHLADCVQLFGYPLCEISQFANTILDHTYDNFQHLLNIFNHLQLTPEVLEKFAQVVTEKGGTLPDTWGFLDGTVRPIARPICNQHHVYNRHKCVHALKFQGLMIPNGLIVHLAGPWVGRRHDSQMLTESGLYPELEQYAHGVDGRPMHVYGDSAYSLSRYIISPFKGM